jgi:excinuclease Cho
MSAPNGSDHLDEDRGKGKRRRKTRPEFDETQVFEYPTHLREVIADLPSLPGVYTFHGEEGDLPLYIGKSVNIRNRVLSHLRTPAEARLLRQTRRISCIRTAGEIGALLLEARLIKTLHPLHNQRLRVSKQLFAWRFVDGVPALVNAKEVNFATESGLFGLYASRHSAEQQLRNLADEQRLCYGLLGLEKARAGRPCFRSQLRQCLGACCGRETLKDHRSRLELALQNLNVVCWPFPGAVALVEQQADLKDIHVVQNWCYLGTVKELEAAKALISVHASFDADSYKILCRTIVGATIQIISL